MFAICTTQAGQCFGMPDTCLTPAPPAPPIPIPYPNIGMLMQTIPTTCSKKMFIMNMPVILLQSNLPMTSGDEAGVSGGVMSGTIKGPVKFKKGSSKVIADGQPVVLHLAMCGQNGTNVPAGTIVAPSQFKAFATG